MSTLISDAVTMQIPPKDTHTPVMGAPTCPMNYPSFVLRTLCDDGYDAQALLADTGLTEELFANPHVRVEFSTLLRFVANAIEHTGDPHLGARLAQRFDPNYIGLPAYAAMNAASLGDALEILKRFFSLTFSAIEFDFAARSDDLKPDERAICLRPKAPLGNVAYFVSISALIATNCLLKAILGAVQVASRAEVTVDKPDGWEAVGREIGFVPTRFQARENRLIFPAELLNRPLPGADPISHQQFVSLCEDFVTTAGHDNTPVAQVLAYLEAEQDLSTPLVKVAEALGYSERSLRRKLEGAGASYRKLVEQVRENRARRVLTDTSRPIQAIAFELGYESPSNFARSFKRWTGLTPKAFRQARKAGAEGGRN